MLHVSCYLVIKDLRMLVCTFVLTIWMYFGMIEKCHSIPDIFPAVMEEFRIYQPIIQRGDMSTRKEMIEVLKNLNFNGYSIGFGLKQFNQYQSCVIFTIDLTQFKWNNPTYAPILVVSTIQTEDKLKEVDVSIGSEVIFLDWVSLKVYESYTINKIQITRYLGQFQVDHKINAKAKFLPSLNYNSNMENRRSNFYGIHLTGAISWMAEDPGNYSNIVQYFPNNNTYDITKLSNNPKYYGKFWSIVELKILKIMESKFNFTTKLFLRKDMKYGSPHISTNGSIVIGEGVFQYLLEGSIEFIWDYWYISPIRQLFVDFLPTIQSDHDAMFVPIEDTYEEIDWTVFLQPFARGVWIAIIIKCIIFSLLVSIIEWFHDCNLVNHSTTIVCNILASFTPNFGVSPFESKHDHITSYNAILLAFALDGLVFWISYQSFLYDELSTAITKDPFNDLDSLANSNNLLYTGPKDWAFFNILSSTQAYEKVMENNVDLKLSFNSWDISIQNTLNTSKSAIFADSAFLEWGQVLSKNGKDLPCLLKPVWKTYTTTMLSSVMMKKGSQFTRFFSKEIRKLQTTGNLDLLRKRNTGNRACKPLLKEKPLGYEKLAFLFVMLIFGCIMSIFVAYFEYMTQTKKKIQEHTNKEKEKSFIEEKIGKVLEGLSNQETENIVGRLFVKHFINNIEDTKLYTIRSDDSIFHFKFDCRKNSSKIPRLLTQRNSI